MIDILKHQCEKYYIDWKFIKFLFVGAINTLFGYSIYALFIFLHFHYAWASFLSTVLGICFNFKTTGIIVFHNNDNKLILNFFAVYGIIYILNVLGLKLFNSIHFNMYLAGIIMVLPMAIISFVLMKKFVFVNKRGKNEKN